LDAGLQRFGKAVEAASLQKMLDLVAPSEQSAPLLLNSLISAVKEIQRMPSASTTTHAVVSKQGNRAHTMVIYRAPGESPKSLRFLVQWKLSDGKWQVVPDTTSRGLKVIVQ
ncbi:MAG: hypothetical protein AAF517_16470, partial [Planctomycetota bacterium]